jgi:hypothetical protein
MAGIVSRETPEHPPPPPPAPMDAARDARLVPPAPDAPEPMQIMSMVFAHLGLIHVWTVGVVAVMNPWS